MCRETEVRAQVRLSFKGTDGAKLVCIRSLQVTMKAQSRVQKTLESQLVIVKNGERSSLSSKCANINATMLHYLGVSKAVLEYVIFCHQDESLWPMSEPAMLKRRFDEIFEALKFTNVIKTMKDLVKKQKIELGEEKVRLEQYRIDKDRAERAEKKSRDLHNETEGLREKIKTLDDEIKANYAESQEHFRKATNFEATIAALNGKRQQRITMQENINDLEQHVEDADETDAELVVLLRDYQKKMQTFEATIQQNEVKRVRLEQELVKARDELGAKLTEKGKATAEKMVCISAQSYWRQRY